MLEIIEIL